MDTHKIPKIKEDGIYSIKNFSDVLCQPFGMLGYKARCYMYKLMETKGFGVLYPIKYDPEPFIIQYIGIRHINHVQLDLLTLFQNIMWSDFFRVTPALSDDISAANYLVVPLKKNYINWKAIEIALKKANTPDLASISLKKREKYVYRWTKNNQTHYYLLKVTNKTQLNHILDNIPVESLYSQMIPDEIHQNILLKAQEIIRDAIASETKNFSLILCRPTSIIRKVSSKQVKPIKPGSLRLIPESELTVFYLTRSQYQSGINLLKSLITLERLSYLIEFKQKYNYIGSFKVLSDATSTPSFDNENNYDALEHLGDSVLKIITSIQLYLQYPKDNEGLLTDKRSLRVKNKHLTTISVSNELYNYLRGLNIKSKYFRPAFYSGVLQKFESYSVNEKFSDGTLADLVESLIGAFYLSSGFLSAAKLAKKLKVLSNKQWESTLSFLSDDYINLYTAKDFENFSYRLFKDLIPEVKEKSIKEECDYTILEDSLGYKFVSKDILMQAFMHSSLFKENNYERLEFLGDAVMDVIVTSNMFSMGKFTAEKLTVFKHMLVNNNVFCKLSLSLGLHTYIRAAPEVINEIKKYLDVLDWEENLLDFGVYNSDPPKYLNDVFEALVGSVLIDSNSLDRTCRVFGPLLKNCMICLGINHEKCNTNVRCKLAIHCQRNNLKFSTIMNPDGDRTCAEIFVNNDFICKVTARTSWLAKQQASDMAYSILIRNSL